jgi:pimeloyl-ACP methyl ester carboxylesterase
MIITNPILPPEEGCDPAPLPPPTPLILVDDKNEARLIPELRQAAQTRNPIEILCRSAVASLGGCQEVATALADLSVTGRDAYTNFRQQKPSESDLVGRVQQRVQQAPPQSIQSSVSAALDRAYGVALALRGTVPERTQLRPPLGWIAVSGEDDPPHRPVNVPAAPYPQYDLSVMCGGIKIQTRYIIASPWPDPSPANPGGRTIPADPAPLVPLRDQIILFIHGMDSRAEECLSLVRCLHQIHFGFGIGYTMIAMDLPCAGYSQMIDHTSVAPPMASYYDRENLTAHVPILEFYEQFIVSFVDALDSQVKIKDRIVGVIGGSLGGNMGLRLGSRTEPWLKNIVAWSPASVWDSFGRAFMDPATDAVLSQANLNHPRDPHGYPAKGPHTFFDLAKCTAVMVSSDRMIDDETDGSRHTFFFQAFDDDNSYLGTIPGGRPQPQLWWRDGWPCKPGHILAARLDRQEIYNAAFRRWHWRLGLEQLIFSHRDPADLGLGVKPGCASIHSNMLLVSGESDNDSPAQINAGTKEIAKSMSNPGRTLFLQNTGHSIHDEHPLFLAGQIADFLPIYVDYSIYANQLSAVWDIWANGFASTLRITSIDDLGNVQGSVFDNLLTGFWDEESRTLTFLRIPNGAYPATFQVYVGHMFQNQDGGYFSLAGSFEAFAGTGGTAQRAEFGWVAKPQTIG